MQVCASIVFSVRRGLDSVRIWLITVRVKFSPFLLHLLSFSRSGRSRIDNDAQGVFWRGEINKLLQYPDYGQVLLIEPPEEKGLPPKKRRVQTERGHHQLPSISELAHLRVELESRIEGEAPPAHDELKGTGPVSADLFNLSDLRQVLRLQEYLQDNASLELFHTPKNGQCLFASIRRGLEILKSTEVTI